MAPPRRFHEPITLRLSHAMLEEIDELRREEKDLPSRPEMVRRIIEAYLEGKEKVPAGS
tara:strand:- start:822 stop:998 length:177 start_codon:yes stop_codon:yes gene_type:complete